MILELLYISIYIDSHIIHYYSHTDMVYHHDFTRSVTCRTTAAPPRLCSMRCACGRGCHGGSLPVGVVWK